MFRCLILALCSITFGKFLHLFLFELCQIQTYPHKHLQHLIKVTKQRPSAHICFGFRKQEKVSICVERGYQTKQTIP